MVWGRGPVSAMSSIIAPDAALSGFRSGRGERTRDAGHAGWRPPDGGRTASLRQHAGARVGRAVLGHAAAVARDPARAGDRRAGTETAARWHHGAAVRATLRAGADPCHRHGPRTFGAS